MAKRISTSGIGMKRRNSPGRVANQPVVVLDSDKPLCETPNCTKRSVVYRKFRWRCAIHDPGNIPMPGCRHEEPSPFLGELVCPYCGFIINKENQ